MLAARAPRAPAPARPGPLVSRTASPLSAQDVLDRRVLERELGIHPLQLRVLGLQLPQPLQLVDRGARVLRPPMEVGRLADIVLPEDLDDRDPRLPLLQDADDLALGEPRLSHGHLLGPGKSTFELSTGWGSLRTDLESGKPTVLQVGCNTCALAICLT